LAPGRGYAVLAGDTPDGPFDTILDDITIDRYRLAEIVVPSAKRQVYRLVER